MPFMIVTYPWPVPSANVELFGLGRPAPHPEPQEQGRPAAEPDQERRILVSSKA